tara:strand:+ start:269 stop:1063 length:795 start_codon:yes stop_codon:yes gene_type:complete
MSRGISKLPVIVGLAFIAGTILLPHHTAEAALQAEDINARAASCPALPNVIWWKTTHVKIVNYVDRKYGGNWHPYIQKWENYRAKMQDILERDGTALVKSRDIRLRGEQLARHIVQIEQRIVVTRCLQDKFSGQMAKGGQAVDPNIHFASLKSQSQIGAAAEDRVSSINEAKLDVEVTARCDGDTPTFQVTNLGKKWPRLAAISIHRTKGNALVSKRRMKLANSQQATFKIRKRGKALKGEIGIFVQPSWAKRPFRYDTTIRCK